MKYITLFILIIILLSGLVFAADETSHCWRQDISRVTTEYTSPTGFDETSGQFTTNSSDYDYIVQPGTKYIFNGIQVHTWECDNGAAVDHKDFAVIWDRFEGQILKTNRGGLLGPQLVNTPACIKNNNYCYLEDGQYYPAKNTCSSGGSIGQGVDESIDYTFTPDDMGEHILTAEIAAISPASDDPYNSKILYKAIPDSRTKIFVGNPSLLVFGPEQEIIQGTYTSEGEIELFLLYTIMNRSFFDSRIIDYNVICPSGITCVPDNTYKTYPIKAETEITIPVSVRISNTEAPKEIAINMELEFMAEDIADCDPNADGNYCHTQAQPTKIKLGLLDQQDFQVKSIDTADSDSCVGLDGIVGVTGEEYAPKVNLEFGGGTDPLISIDECDKNDINKNPNPDGVYCSQLEFIVELAEKINTIAKLRENIQELESVGKYAEADVLRQEENKYNSFSSYLRAQDFSNALASISTSNDYFLTATGLQTWWPAIEQKTYLEKLYNVNNGVEFVKRDGEIIEGTDIDAGLYTVRIDMNEMAEVTTSNYLFNVGILNPSIDIKVILEKESSPKLDWFFYNEGYTDDFEEAFREIGTQTTTNAYSTNVLNRGEIITFDETSGDINNTSFSQTYAYPLFVIVNGDANGDTNTLITLKDTVEEPTMNFVGKENLSYWTGFASSKGDGCETIALDSQSNFLPYRVPDFGITDTQFYMADTMHNLEKVVPNSKMLLSTVFYLPYTNRSTRKLDFETPMPLYHTAASCSTPPCNLSLQESMSTYKADNLNTIFDEIRNENICVYKSIGTLQEKRWSIFWNEQKILTDLNALAQSISGVTICGE